MQICGGVIRDDKNTAILVLNNSELSNEHKHAYISALQTTIVFINEVTDHALWAELLDTDIVQYSERNIMDSFNVLKLSESVISYINRCNVELDFSKLKDGESIKEQLFENMIKCGSILNSKYEQILVSLGFCYDDFDLLNIPSDKLTILINVNIIKMTANNLIFLRDNYPDQKFCFIRKNIDEYVDIMSGDLFSQEELLEILTWDISDELKIKLLEFSDEAISVIGKDYSITVCLYILDNNFKNSDLITLFSSFEQWDSLVRAKIFDYALRNIATIINNPANVSKKLIDDLLHAEKLNRSVKINLLIAVMPILNFEHIKEILVSLDLSNYARIFDERSRPKFEISDESTNLLSAFQRKGLICSYEKDHNKEGYYKIVRIKTEKKS